MSALNSKQRTEMVDRAEVLVKDIVARTIYEVVKKGNDAKSTIYSTAVAMAQGQGRGDDEQRILLYSRFLARALLNAKHRAQKGELHWVWDGEILRDQFWCCPEHKGTPLSPGSATEQ